MLKAVILGFGGIARSHLHAYQILKNEGRAQLVGLCDIRPEAFEIEVKTNLGESVPIHDEYHTYTDLDEMLEKERPDFVDICLPTYLHKEYTVRLLKHGCHVICEKPMSLCYEDCLTMLRTAEEMGKLLMIGQCLHFYPEYEFLKEAVEDGRFGAPKSAYFHRLSPPPVWGWDNWFMDESRSGGCILDLHVHDIDMARWLFGDPKTVSCRSKDGYGKWDMAHSTLGYNDLTATVVADWSFKNMPFEAHFRVAFERATVVCTQGKTTVYPMEGEPYTPDLKPGNGRIREILYFADILLTGAANLKNDPASAAKSVRLVEALRRSAELGGQQLNYET